MRFRDFELQSQKTRYNDAYYSYNNSNQHGKRSPVDNE